MNRKKWGLLNEIQLKLEPLTNNPDSVDDQYVKICIKEAIVVAREGNVGVGALLLNDKEEIVQKGHNRAFNPHYRSDLHAEMDVITNFEEQNKKIETMYGYKLYTSLEPCPMCLIRLICSGVSKLCYVAEDNIGGMVHLRNNMPPIWREFSAKFEFQKAHCSKELADIALEVWELTLDEVNKKFWKRQKPK
jgi:cytosine deaminase